MMSEPEKKSGGGAETSVVLVEQTTTSRHKQPFRPLDMQEDAHQELQHKRSKAPAGPSVTEVFKDNANPETREQRECERVISSEKQKQSIAKTLSSTKKWLASSPESITLATIDIETKKGTITPPTVPIPAQVSSVTDQTAEKHTVESNDEEDSITDEITELRTPAVARKSSEWSDEEEAGGLPRSESRESRASRVSRAMRQLFCCGVRLDTPSEHEVSPRGLNAI